MIITEEQIELIKRECRDLATQILRSKYSAPPYTEKAYIAQAAKEKIPELYRRLMEKIDESIGERPPIDPIEFFSCYGLPTKYGIRCMFAGDINF